MRLALLERNGERGVAAATDGVFHGFFENEPGYPGDLDTLLFLGWDFSRIGKTLLAGPILDVTGCRFLSPLLRPSKILCVGLNYQDHLEEVGLEKPAYPTIFCRVPSCLVGHGAPMVKPAESDELDYEVELAAVIGKRGRRIPEEKALEHIGAYSVFNDASVRDYQMLTSQWTLGKNFDATGAFGPWLVTADDLPPGGKGLAVSTRLNGVTVQASSTDHLIYPLAALVTILSNVMTLEPGDIIVTGTPAGVGMSRKPPLYMKDGDVVEVEVENIGVLRNPVVAGKV